MIQFLSSRPDCEGDLAETFRLCGFTLDRPTQDRWAVAPIDGVEPAMRIRYADGWWLLDAQAIVRIEPGELSSEELFQLLRFNRTAEGAAKIVVLPDGISLGLRAEILGGDMADPLPSLAWTCRGLAAASLRLSTLGLPEFPDDVPLLADPATVAILGENVESDCSPDAVFEHAECDLGELCAASDWPCTERGKNFMVTLEVPDGFQQALIEQEAGRGVTARVALLSGGELHDGCRRAVAAWLLAVSGLVRGIRAVVWEQSGSWVAGFEAALGPSPTATQLSELLGALSVACGWFGKETSALTDERIAEVYLELRGRSS